MKLYLEIENIDQILDRINTNLIDGVIVKNTDDKNYRQLVRSCLDSDVNLDLAKLNNVVALVDGETQEEIYTRSMEIARQDPAISVLVPNNLEGLKAITSLSQDDVNTCISTNFYKSVLYKDSLVSQIFVDFSDTSQISSLLEYYKDSDKEIIATNVQSLEDFSNSILFGSNGVVLNVDIFDSLVNL